MCSGECHWPASNTVLPSLPFIDPVALLSYSMLLRPAPVICHRDHQVPRSARPGRFSLYCGLWRSPEKHGRALAGRLAVPRATRLITFAGS